MVKVEKTDETLMLEVKRGNLAEMSPIFERYNVRLYNYFRHMGFSMDTSKDLTQNVFFRMIRYRGSYREGKPVKAWMYQIARNLCNDYSDELKKSGNMIISGHEYKADIPEPESEFSEEEYRILDEAILALPEEQKDLIILCRFQGLRYSEASEILNMSVPAIKTGMFRAIKKLQHIYFKKL